ncbi:unnamed protein product [Orchesella dallaii]|uniref:Integrin alpha-2 domain-containing protein n=1 Tax=Orchesella dallaii TaxID=48710 RepID=A0ABP1QYD2_9HEXA
MSFKGFWECTGTYMEYPTGSGDKRLLRNRDSECYSYLGYSITSGRKLGQGEYVAVGAPRGRNTYGYVLLNNLKSSSPNMKLVGEQFGAYFGYSLATTDLNGDGKDELLVGAPLFTKEFNNDRSLNGGCVFAYDVDMASKSTSQLGKFCLEDKPKGARFGSAIANLGDINFDQKEDFAVAAPYHDDGVGTVFIYYGGFPLSTTPVQVISGKALGIPNLRAFGTSLLSGNLDVDGNSTPDLAISSFESNHVVVFRTRPVAKATLKVTFHTDVSQGKEGKIIKFLPTQSERGFRVRICNKFQFSVALRQNFQLECWVQFDMDKRIELKNNKPGHEFVENFYSKEETCIDSLVKLKPEFVEEGSKNPIRFRAGLFYNDTKQLVSEPVKQAHLNFSEGLQSTSQFERNINSFKKYDPVPIPLTYSVWETLDIAQDNCDSDGNATCNPTLKLEGDIHFEYNQVQNKSYQGKNQKFRVGQVDAIVLSISLSNQGETAYRSNVRVSLDVMDNKFEVPVTTWHWQVKDLNSSYKDEKIEEISGSVTDFTAKSEFSSLRPLQNQTKITYQLAIRNLEAIKVIEDLTGSLALKIEAYPEGQQEIEKVKWNHLTPMEAQVKVEVEALTPSTGQSKIDPLNNRVDLSQIYILKNTGHSSIATDKIKAEIYVPTHAKVNNVLKPVVGIVNPAHYSSKLRCEPHGFSFYDLDTNPEVTSTKLPSSAWNNWHGFFSPTDQLITLSGCDAATPNAYCHKITCYTDLPSIETRAVRLHMYILPGISHQFLTNEYTGIRIQSRISVTYLKTMVVKTEGTTTRLFLIQLGIPLWIILVAGAGGSILFLCVALALHKCGFFRRKGKEQLQTLKRQTLVYLEFNNMEVPSQQTENGNTKTATE